MNSTVSPVFTGFIHKRKQFGVSKTSINQDAAFLDCFIKAANSPRMQRDHGLFKGSDVLKLGQNFVVTTQKSGKVSLLPFKMVTIQLIDNDGKEQFKWEMPKSMGLRSSFKRLEEVFNKSKAEPFKFNFSSPEIPGPRSSISNFYEQIETMYTGKVSSRELGQE